MITKMIRGMLPYGKKPSGIEAHKRLRAYIGSPKELKSIEKIQFEKAKIKKICIKLCHNGRIRKSNRVDRMTTPKTEIYFATRKTSSAHVYITKGQGKVRINNVPVEMIPQETAREVILAPLEITGDLREKIDISQ